MGNGFESLPAIPKFTAMNILITGGAGFIGSHVVHHFVQAFPQHKIVNVDALTYAGNTAHLQSIAEAENYHFIQADICDQKTIEKIFTQHDITHVLHLAAESHVDRSIEDPLVFAKTNVLGTLVLLEAARQYWKDSDADSFFYHISTDEVYGALGEKGMFTEQSPYAPRSPYSASKASSDHFVRAYSETYGLPIKISNCSNNYGPHQFPEKLIPLCIEKIKNQAPIPVYGTGENIRDWLYVEDHVAAIKTVFDKGRLGETYLIGGNNEWKNIVLIGLLIALTDAELGNPPGHSKGLIQFVEDRPGHDLRYAIDASKIQNDLGWQPQHSFEEGLRKTVQWYLQSH